MNPETIALGVNTTIIGMGVVFVVLIILSFTTWLLTAIVDGGIERKKAAQAAKAAAAAPAAPAAPAAQTVPSAPSEAGLSAKTVAAIAAAISAASGIPASQLRFTAIRRVGGVQGAWANSGTIDIISNRQTYL